MANINCTAFKIIKQAELKTFTDKVYNNTNGKAVYAPVQDAISSMDTAAIAFQEALVNAATRDSEKIRLKNDAYVVLIQQITRLAKSMDAQWVKPEQDYIKIEAGFTLNKTPQRKVVTYVEPPTELEAYNLKARGQIVISWKRAEYAVTTAFEFLQEDGTWKNGMYNEKEYVELTYPFGTKLTLRAMTIGPNMLKSSYSEPVEVLVS